MGANFTSALCHADHGRCFCQPGHQEMGKILETKPVYSEHLKDLEFEDTESTRSSIALSERIEGKASMASRVLRSLADSDYQRAWERLRNEFECQKTLWGIVEKMDGATIKHHVSSTQYAHDSLKCDEDFVLAAVKQHGLTDSTVGMRGLNQVDTGLAHLHVGEEDSMTTPRTLNPIVRDGFIAALRSKTEFALAMAAAGDSQAIYVLEALLSLNDTMTKQLSAKCPAAASSALSTAMRVAESKEPEASSPGLSQSFRASAQEILAMVPVRQARNDLADFCDEVVANEHSRFARSADWAATTAKACQLRHGVLKEYLSDIVAFDGRQRLAMRSKFRIPSSTDDWPFV